MRPPADRQEGLERAAIDIPADAVHRRFAAIGGVELELPELEPMRAPPAFA
jgi:hypothetical protein